MLPAVEPKPSGEAASRMAQEDLDASHAAIALSQLLLTDPPLTHLIGDLSLIEKANC
jgi:hypothetical protein